MYVSVGSRPHVMELRVRWHWGANRSIRSLRVKKKSERPWAHADREFELEMDAAQGGEVTFATEQGKEISDAVKLAHRSWSRAKREAVLAQSGAAPSPRRPRRPRSSSMRRSNTGIQLMPMTPPIPAGLPHPTGLSARRRRALAMVSEKEERDDELEEISLPTPPGPPPGRG